MDQLSEDLHAEIEKHSEAGNALIEAGDAAGAIAVWRTAFSILPEPRNQWDAALWLHASIGDAQRSQGDLQGALASFQAASASGDGRANAFVQINLGMTLYDLGDRQAATEPLLRAYMLEGEDIFDDFGRYYLDHLKAQRLVE